MNATIESIRFLEDRAALCADVLAQCVRLTALFHEDRHDIVLHWSECPNAHCAKTAVLLQVAAHGLPS